MNDPSKQIVNWKNVSTPEERIAELENNCKAMTAEIEKLKVELAEKNETVWIPEIDDSYMYIDSSGDVIDTFSRGDNALDNYRINFNNAYHSSNTTREHLKWYANNVLHIQNKLMQLHELLCPDYFPDWNPHDKQWFIFYDNIHKCFNYNYNYEIIRLTVYFTKEAAEKACEILNREKFMIEDISENK